MGSHDSLPDVSLDSSSIERAFEIGRQAYPGIDLPRAAFVSFAQARTETWSGSPERAADLYLACACVERLPAAVAEFLGRFGKRIPVYLGRLARDPDLVAEVRQIVVTRSIVGDPGNPPSLNTYSGTGSLEGWLRATAVREALALNRRASRNTDGFEAALEARTPWADHEISLFKQMYREPVSRAFAAACSQIGREDRALLRLHYVEGVTTANLANMYGISRATLIRRLAAARESLLERVKSALKDSARIADRDFDSILRLVQSQIDLRLSRVLAGPD
jgi:RNA polymerase sigma-70 factor, ECF subfamily